MGEHASFVRVIRACDTNEAAAVRIGQTMDLSGCPGCRRLDPVQLNFDLGGMIVARCEERRGRLFPNVPCLLVEYPQLDATPSWMSVSAEKPFRNSVLALAHD